MGPTLPPPPLSRLGRAALAASSAVLALRNPGRADLVASLSDATAGPALSRLTARLAAGGGAGAAMLSARSPARFPGDALFEQMRTMADGSLGREYARFMEVRRFDYRDRPPVNRALVRSDDEAWVLQRYRDVHDLWHVVCDVPTTVFGEICLKWFEAVQTGGLPGPMLSAVGGPMRLSGRERAVLVKEIVPWAVEVGGGCVDLMAVRYEDVVERPVTELREEWRVRSPRAWLSDAGVLYRRVKRKGA
jgi:ubiquinone biosynthesis protein COQ4